MPKRTRWGLSGAPQSSAKDGIQHSAQDGRGVGPATAVFQHDGHGDLRVVRGRIADQHRVDIVPAAGQGVRQLGTAGLGCAGHGALAQDAGRPGHPLHAVADGAEHALAARNRGEGRGILPDDLAGGGVHGAVVTAYDVRPASQGDVESLGAKFLDLGLDFSKGQGEGGYARALSAEEQAQQQAAVDEKAAGFDIIITTAKVPGRKPPVLLTAAGVKGLKRGAVIVDCAASDLGGNVEGSAVGEQVTEGGVKLIGAPYLASGVATTASNLLSRNVADILVHFVRDGKLGQDLTEELDDALVVAGRAAAPAAAADAEKSEK